MPPKIAANHSEFWLGDKFSPAKSFGPDGTMSLVHLAAYRRAIANFTFILTGKTIPVRFAENDQSFTDGKVIYIGGELSKGMFDTTVGLALHESMHIVKSDFDLIRTMWGKLPRSLRDAAKGKFTDDVLGKYSHYVLNVVEDRYIDAWAYDMAPGYRGYYDALYAQYFLVAEITEALRSDAYRTPTWQNYKFRFTNIMNPASDLDALPALRKIHHLLDLENILRDDLSTPKGRMELAYVITEAIVESVVEAREDTRKKQREKQKTASGTGSQSSNSKETDSGEEGEPKKTSSSGSFDSQATEAPHRPNDDSEDGEEDKSGGDSDMGGNSGDVLGGIEATSDAPIDDPDEDVDDADSKESEDMSPDQIAQVDKLIQVQEDFVNHRAKRTKFDASSLQKLKVLEKSDINLVPVGGDEGVPEVECIVVNNMTEELMFSGEFPFSNQYTSDRSNPESVRGIADGIVLGTMLGRKLQIRSEVNTTKYSRLAKGKIDRRLLSAIGYNSEDLFYQTSVDKYNNVHLHVTVDASYSMANKWKKTMTTLVGMAKAVSMINNVSMSISLRAGVGEIPGKEQVYVVIAYDSRKDKFSKIISLFRYLFPTGSTPEGLAFQAILDNIPANTHTLDSYFVNLSDGAPAFNMTYFGPTAAKHTKKQVDKIREAGVHVLSYFIESASDSENSTNTNLFKVMYGKDAQFIDVENVVKIAYTMNQLFLSKKN